MANENLSKAAMFMMGFIMLLPHRIALSCSPHVIKRFHLPPATVPLFIYKIHSPMELASLCGTFLANVLTWVNDATIKTMYLKRYCSITFMWLMFICSVMTYYLFISGDDFGYLNHFYWNMVFFTLIYGFMSSFCFGINFNTSMAAAGLPTSGGFTFMLHKVYHWLYEKYHWAEYDYYLMILQLTTTMGFLLFSSILWTVDQCWNILEPEYKSFLIQGILDAANNKTTTEDNLKATSITYYVSQKAPRNDSGNKYQLPADNGDYKTINVNEDLAMRWGGVAKKMTDDAKNELRNCWRGGNYKKPIIAPLVLSGIMSGLSFISIFMAMFATYFMDSSKLYVLVGIITSILVIISIISNILSANAFDKDDLKDVNIKKANLGVYTGHTNWYKINATVGGGNTGDATNNPTVNDVQNATDNKYYF